MNGHGVDQSADPSRGRAVIAIILVGALMRLAFGSAVGMELDGSYSAGIAREYLAGYFDHPPMHYWLIKATGDLFGREGWILRLPFILLFAGSTWLMYRLTALVFNERAGVWAALSLNLSPPFSIAFGMFLLPDGPLIFFTLLAAWLVARVVFAEGPPVRSNASWLAAGTASGLALLSKYSAAFLFFGLFLFLLTTRHRRLLALPAPWLGALIGAIVFLPALIWNWQHDWVSLGFQAGRAAPSLVGGPQQILDSIFGQFGYLTLVFLPMAWLLVRAVIRGPAHERSWLFACLAGPPILFFTFANLLQPGLPHWTMPGWLFAFPLLGAWIASLADRWRQWVAGLSWLAAGAFAAGMTAVAIHANTGFLDPLLERAYSDDEYLGNDPLLEFFDWTDIEAELNDRGLLTEDTAFLAAVYWTDAGRLNYAVGRDYPVLCVCGDPHHFQLAHDTVAFAGGTGLLIGRPAMFNRHRAFIDSQYDRIEVLAPITLNRGTRPALELQIERGIGFRPNGD